MTGKISGGQQMKVGVHGLDAIHGYSAYELAILNGYEGTEEEWLASLKGEKGEKGETGTASVLTMKYQVSSSIFQSGLTNEWSESIPVMTATDKYLWAQFTITEGLNERIWFGIIGVYGDKGEAGVTPNIGDNGNWWIGETDTGVSAGGSGSSGNGNDGDDYVLTDADKAEIAELAAGLVEIPETTMRPLTFTGAAEATYDGSEAVNVEIPSGEGNDKWELIDTIDFSSEELSGVANAGKSYTLDHVTEIITIYRNMENEATANSFIAVKLNGKSPSQIGPRTGKTGTPLNGYTYYQIKQGVGAICYSSGGAINAVNYSIDAGSGGYTYNIPDVTEPITQLSFHNPGTQYIAIAGTFAIYVR